MITKLVLHESVPLGGDNFTSYLDYVRGFLGANFGFSTNVLDNQGGYFSDDEFEYYDVSLGSGKHAYFFGPRTKTVGNLFGRIDNEYFRFEILNLETQGTLNPQIYKWEVLLTDSLNPVSLRYENNIEDEGTPEQKITQKLPYRPVRYHTSAGQYDYGYTEVRVNGIPQTHTTFTYNYTGNSYANQRLEFTKLRLGAEFPEPILNNRYDSHTNFTRPVLETKYNNTVTLSHSNFSVDYGGHVLLWRTVNNEHLFVYLRQDYSSGTDVAPGRFKVIDYAKGTLKVNIQLDQLNRLATDTERATPGFNPETQVTFNIVSAEQLREEVLGGIGQYYTRYGNVYDGETGNVILAEYIFDGNSHIVRHIPATDYYSGIGDLLLQDLSGRYDDSIILGIQYYALPNTQEIERVQTTRYTPDTIQLYYHAGIVMDDPDSSIRSFVEQNNASWYNRDVRDAEYFPVHRAVETYPVYINEGEAHLFGDVFDPNQHFRIVDTVNVIDLSDVGDVQPGQVLHYEEVVEDGEVVRKFVGRDYKLAKLHDVNLSGLSNNHILQYDAGSNEWKSKTRQDAFQNVGGNMSYSAGVSNALGDNTPDNVLVTKKFVQDRVDTLHNELDVSTVVRTFGDQSIGGNKAFVERVVLGKQANAANHAVRADRQVSAGSGLSGGGNLTGNVTLSVATGGITTSMVGDGQITFPKLHPDAANNIVLTTGDQSVGGKKTFTSPAAFNDAISVGGEIALSSSSNAKITKDMTGTTGGWARSLLEGKAGSKEISLGIYGNANSITYAYIGKARDDAALKITEDGKVGIRRSGSNVPASDVDITGEVRIRDLGSSSTWTAPKFVVVNESGVLSTGDTSGLGSAAYENTSAFVPVSRQITAGTGLTGGGTLSSNRTLSVDNTVVRTSGNQSIAGAKTFSGTVTVPTPSSNSHAATKKYVDDQGGKYLVKGSGSTSKTSNQDVYGTVTFRHHLVIPEYTG